MEKKVIIVGSIGKTERMNRDAFRVMSGGGTAYTLTAHISKDKPLILRKWKRKLL